MRRDLTKWKKYLTEQKSDLSSIVKQARRHVISLLPMNKSEVDLVGPDTPWAQDVAMTSRSADRNTSRLAALLGNYYNAALSKENKLTNFELITIAGLIGNGGRAYINDIPVHMLNSAQWKLTASDKKGWHMYAFYDPNDTEISVNVDLHRKHFPKSFKNEIFSSITHELWHAIDDFSLKRDWNSMMQRAIMHDDLWGVFYADRQGRGSLKPKFNAFADVIYSDQSDLEFMSKLNLAHYDKLLQSRTIRSPEESEEKEKKAKSKEQQWKRYQGEGTERYVRFKHLIDAFRQINHPGSIVATADDIIDFCTNSDKYTKIHSDIADFKHTLVACKKLRAWRKSGMGGEPSKSSPFAPDDVSAMGYTSEKGRKEQREIVRDDILTLNRIAKAKIPQQQQRMVAEQKKA